MSHEFATLGHLVDLFHGCLCRKVNLPMVDDFDRFVILLISDLIRGLEETRDRSEELVFVFLGILDCCSFFVASSCLLHCLLTPHFITNVFFCSPVYKLA